MSYYHPNDITRGRAIFPEWKLFIFDFDDTLYLKSTYEFIPHIHDILFHVRMHGIPMGILTYSHRALSILQSHGLDTYFEFIVTVATTQDNKSETIQKVPLWNTIPDKRTILFFDNDSYNIYDMKKTGITCFLVNPVNGILKDTIHKLCAHDYQALYQTIRNTVPRTYNYVERTTLVQNLEQLDNLLLYTDEKNRNVCSQY
jgi:FMN phosphatase YigB (HAD superfamily)